MNYAISAYPLSRDFQTRLESHLKHKLNYLVLGEMRMLSPLRLLSYLRSLKANNLYIPIEEYSNQFLLPILNLMAAFVSAKSIEIIYPDLISKKLPRMKAFFSLLGFLQGSLIGLFYGCQSYYQLKKMLHAKPIDILAHQNNKILYLNANLWFGLKAGGAVGHITGVAQAFAERNFTVDYAAVDRLYLLPTEINFQPLHVAKTFGLPKELNYFRFNATVIKQLFKKYKHQSLQFIYQRMSIANYTGAALSQILKIPLILEYNGSEAWVAQNWGTPLYFYNLAWNAEQASLEQASAVVTISKALKDELIQRGIKSEKIIYYPNCIDPEIFNPDAFDKIKLDQLRQHYKLNEDSIVLSFVGTFGKWHGVNILAKAIRELVEQDSSWLLQHKVHFLLIGDGVTVKEVCEILAEKSCQQFVTLTGLIPQQETPQYMALSDILLSPHINNGDGSKFFGSPTKLFEYMSMGKGIIASNLEQIGEVLQNSLHASNLPADTPSDKASELGVLCKAGDVQELIMAIKFLVEKKDWRKKLGFNARNEALSKYTWAHHVDTILEKLKCMK